MLRNNIICPFLWPLGLRLVCTGGVFGVPLTMSCSCVYCVTSGQDTQDTTKGQFCHPVFLPKEWWMLLPTVCQSCHAWPCWQVQQGLSRCPRQQTLERVWRFLSSLPVTAVLTLKIEWDCLISRQKLLKRVNYVTFIICSADLFRQIWLFFFFFTCIPAFINQDLQHSHTQHEGDAELPRAHFNTAAWPGCPVGAGSGRGYCCGLSQ